MVTDPGHCLFCLNLKVEKKKKKKKRAKDEFPAHFGNSRAFVCLPRAKNPAGLLMGCSALSNGLVGFAVSLFDVGGFQWVMDFSTKTFSGMQAEPSPSPICVLTEASLCCRQPCAAVVAQIYCSLPCLHSELAPYGAEAGETMLGTAGTGLGGSVGAALLQLAPFEVQYFNLLPLTTLLPQLRSARHLQCSRSIPVRFHSRLAAFPLLPLRSPCAWVDQKCNFLVLTREIFGWPPRRL